MPKLVAILGGGDWYDASVDHLVIPDDMDLEKEREMRNRYYHEVYAPRFDEKPRPEFYTFPQWLIMRGARGATEEEITVFED